MTSLDRAGTIDPRDVEAAPRLSIMAGEIRPSAILSIAAEIRALRESGAALCDLTVGDFSPAHFPIPRPLLDALVDALQSGETNYPASPGMDVMRRAVAEFYRRRRELDYPTSQVLIASGARPLIYALYRILVDPGDRVVFGVPSWNNDYYCDILGAVPVPVVCGADVDFLPTASLLRNAVRGARLLALNSPLNPTGTLFDADALAGICDLVLEENARRSPDERPLYVMYDQVYWMLTFGPEHVDPVSLRPEMAPYTVLVDAISKCFAATGLRVGWATGPADIIQRMADISSHIGAWAPRAEQIATAKLLAQDTAIDAFHVGMKRDIRQRLTALADGLGALRSDGMPVDCTVPQGAMYLSARFPLHGMRTAAGQTLHTNEDVRKYLLQSAGLAAVPFQAFGMPEESGWFRLSVGAVSMAQLEALLPRLREALSALS